jgi:transketolase
MIKLIFSVEIDSNPFPRQTMNQPISSKTIRHSILEIAFRAHVGHIGSALSVADIIAALYGSVLNIPSPRDAERDRLVLSKGHAAMALYAALYTKGWITQKQLDGYCQDGSLLGTHPDRETPGVDFCTGSLGQGICYAVGSALAARHQRSSRRVFVIVSDAECNEGSLWEAIMFAAHHHLANLIAIVDYNGQQALGYSEEVLKLSPLAEKWKAFGWDTREVDGHSAAALVESIQSLDTTLGQPHVIIARTVSGKGVSFMEKQIKWHYWPMSEQEYQDALNEIGNKE